MTTVTDAIYNGSGLPVSGTMFITANSQFEGAGGEQVYAQPITVNIGSDGVFTVDLIPNDTATPAGTSYNVNYSLDGPPGFSGQAPEETWVVPTSVPAVGLADVRTSPTPIPDEINYLPLTGGTLTGKLTLSPASGTYALDVTKSGSTGTVRFYDQTATTGVTKVQLRAGAGDSISTKLLSLVENNGTSDLFWVDGIGDVVSKNAGFIAQDAAGLASLAMQGNSAYPAMSVGSGRGIAWSSTTYFADAKDTGVARNAAGVVEVNNGTAGVLRDLIVRSSIGTATAAADASLANSQFMLILTSNTTLQIRAKGSDGTVRFADITLAP